MASTSTGCAITGSGVHTPETVVTNEELCATFNTWVRAQNAAGRNEPYLESSPEWIRQVSGIEQRRYYDAEGILDPERMCPIIPDRPDDSLSVQAEFAIAAAEPALAEAGRTGADIDLVIVGVSNIQRAYPALAIEIQEAIGADGFAFDMVVGCSSGTFALQVALDSIRGGSARRALVCIPEVPSGFTNFRSRDTHFILGDASAALVVEPLENASAGAFEVISTSTYSRFSSAVRNNGGFLNRCDEEHQFDDDKLFYQDGSRVFRDIVRLVPQRLKEQLGELGLTGGDVDRFWLHQANARMNEAAARVIGGESVSAPLVLTDYGNTAAAGAVMAFHMYKDDLARGSIGVLAAFGAGYTMGSQVLRRV